jgi:hypothetical protein
MAEIFLSYRRDDSASATGRLADALEAHFGDERMFRDHEIAAGENFVDAIRRSVESATVVLAIVGRRWLDVRGADGRRRLDDRGDFVRLEIELALAARVAVVPVLVEGATMPAAADLPPSLAEFSRCQAVELRDRRWRAEADALIATLQSRFAIESDRAPLDADAGAGPGAGASAGVGAGALARWGVDLIDLVRHPRRLIARRQTGRAGDHVRAFVFVCAAIVLGHFILLPGIDIGLVARGLPAEKALGVASWILTGLLVLLLVAGVLAATLALAWRLVDRGAGYRRVGLILAYVFAGAWLGWCAGAVVDSTALELIDPGWLQRVVAGFHESMARSAPAPGAATERLGSAPLLGAAIVLLVVGLMIWLATAVWCIVAWGAFRQSFAATRLQAWLATTIWIALLAAIVWLPLQLG